MPSTRLPIGRVMILGTLTALGSLGTHLFVPALPLAAMELDVARPAIQQAISTYVLGLAIGQLVAGPAADVLGRRPVLLGSLGAFLLGSLGCAAAPGIGMLLAARVLQALGASGILVACRAIVADEAGPDRMAGSFGVLFAVTMVSPALAPLAGGLIAAGLGWRSIFIVLGLLAASGLAAFWSVRFDARPAPLAGRELRRHFGLLLGSARFLSICLANGLIVASFYVFLAASPFILTHDHGLTPVRSGFFYFAVATPLILGTMLVRPLESRLTRGSLWPGLGALFAGVITVAAAALRQPLALPAFLAAMMMLGLGSGLLGPALLASAVRAAATLAGSAASLFGAIQMGLTAAISAAAALWAVSTQASLLIIGAAAFLGGAIIVAIEPRRPR